MSTSKKQEKLPDKASDLLTLALNDLAKVERSPRYVVNMHIWHAPNGACSVCFAGAVMAQTLEASPSEGALPGCYPLYTCKRLHSLDAMRCYNWSAALARFPKSSFKVEGVLREAIPSGLRPLYHQDRRKFKLNMRKAARIMRAHGL